MTTTNEPGATTFLRTAADVRAHVDADYAARDKWVPTPTQIQVLFDTKDALHQYVEDIACNIALLKLAAAGYTCCPGTYPWLKSIDDETVTVRYYADNGDRVDDRPSTIEIPLVDVLPEYAKYHAICKALS